MGAMLFGPEGGNFMAIVQIQLADAGIAVPAFLSQFLRKGMFFRWPIAGWR
jgi:hypothetical protein